tara:strand:- start:67 stop:624 length:558 start_codon:yes stop_codon:yes gene_type:complete
MFISLLEYWKKIYMSVLVYSVPNFLNYKFKILELIHNIPETPFENISHSDWDITKNMKRNYQSYIQKNIFKGFAEHLRTTNKFKEVTINSMWFQVYKQGDFHFKHTHPQCHFTNIFFIQLPNNEVKTMIRTPEKNLSQLQFKEGDIITFPSYYEHESPINNSGKDKVIVSFNFDVLYYDNLQEIK